MNPDELPAEWLFIILLFLLELLGVLLLYVVPTDARLLEPYQYKEGECELVAKEYQKIERYGFILLLFLVFIFPGPLFLLLNFLVGLFTKILGF